jgi:hypothetical protein
MTSNRFHLVMDVIDRMPGLGNRAAHLCQLMRDKLSEHHEYICRTGADLRRSASGYGRRGLQPEGPQYSLGCMPR